MMNNILLITIALISPVIVSYAVEALRRKPKVPLAPDWEPELKYQYVEINGDQIRYIKTGSGPVIVLLHTLRTQLDMWQQVIPTLSEHYTVYAMDHIGHGFSDIPEVAYTPKLFGDTVADFLNKLEIKNATLVGESIGGTVGLMLAAKHHPSIDDVVAINSYEYDRGRGVYRSSLIARVLFSISFAPILGTTFWRLRSFPIFQNVMNGGVVNTKSIPKKLMKVMHQVGNRQGHYQAFMSLISHFSEWERVRAEYDNINIPILLLYGSGDWSTLQERDEVHSSIPNATIKTLYDSGHFASLDASENVAKEILKHKKIQEQNKA